MSDPGRTVVAIVAIVSIATTIQTIARAFIVRLRTPRGTEEALGSNTDERMSRLEHAVDAIALEIERISEGQRFTTKLLSEQARQAEAASRRMSSQITN